MKCSFLRLATVVAFVLWIGSSPLLAAGGEAKKPETKAASQSKTQESKTSESKKAEPRTDEAKETKCDKDKKEKGKEKGKKDACEKSESPETHTVKHDLMKVVVELDGVFVARRMTEVVLQPKIFSSFKVLGAVEHGAEVSKGDQLVKLDLTDIDREIADLELELKLSDIDAKLAKQQIKILQEMTSLELESGKRSHREAQQDRDYYFKTERPLNVESAEMSLKTIRQYVENQEEELRQLEKMYKADDLTEETEEIILKRTRAAVEQARFYQKMFETQFERFTKTQLDRQDRQVRDALVRGDLAWQRTQLSLPLALERQQLELQRADVRRERSVEKLKKLQADREMMQAKAPVDGVVYYGKCEQGRFGDIRSTADTLRLGGSLSANEVFMTIVQPESMFVQAKLPEEDLAEVQRGVRGLARPTGYPDRWLNVSVQQVSTIPVDGSDFDVRLSVRLDREQPPLQPGMTCKVKLVPYVNKTALTVPAKCVFTDELNERKQYVYLLGKKDKPTKCYVTVGKRNDEKVEIVKGLDEGDKVLLEKPEKDSE